MSAGFKRVDPINGLGDGNDVDGVVPMSSAAVLGYLLVYLLAQLGALQCCMTELHSNELETRVLHKV